MSTKNQVSYQQKVVQREGNIVSDMAGEKVMLSIQRGKYYNLGEVGGVIWDLMENPITVEEIVSSLMSNYEVEEWECGKQVITFLNQLLDEELIIVH